MPSVRAGVGNFLLFYLYLDHYEQVKELAKCLVYQTMRRVDSFSTRSDSANINSGRNFHYV